MGMNLLCVKMNAGKRDLWLLEIPARAMPGWSAVMSLPGVGSQQPPKGTEQLRLGVSTAAYWGSFEETGSPNREDRAAPGTSISAQNFHVGLGRCRQR